MVILNVQAASIILRQGTVVSTKLGSSAAWYRNIICRGAENAIWLELTVPYLENAIAPGMSISLKYFNEYFLYLFEGVVTNICVGCPSFVEVSLSTAEELVNTRSYPRYDTYLPCTAVSIWSEDTCFCILTNISFGGMAFTCPQRFDFGEDLQIMIYIPGYQPVNVRGKVLNRYGQPGEYEYSLQFTEVDNDNRQILSRHFAQLEEEIAVLRDKYKLD
jgi:hypothetical protein